MPNEVIYYNATTAITDTPATDIFGTGVTGQTYTMLRINNETDLDVIVTFGNNGAFLAKSGDNILQAFNCTADVSLSVGAGLSSTGNFFIQLTRG